MLDERSNIAYVLAGAKGSGKTTLGKNLMFRAAYRNKLATIMKANNVDLDTACELLLSTFETNQDCVDALDVSVIVMDTLDHPAYREGFIRITANMIERIEKPNFYRIFDPVGPKTRANEAAIQKHAYNCVVILEDCFKYISGALTDPQIEFISDSKQKNVDILYMYHGLGQVPPNIYRYLDGMYLLKTNDTPMSCKHKIPAYGQVLEAWHKIEAKKAHEEYPREYINLN